MHQPSRTPAGAGNGLSAGGMHTEHRGDDGGAGEWITIEEAARQLGVAPRTAYDYRRQGKLQYRSERHGQKMRYFTTVAWVEACQSARARWKDTAAAAAPVPEPAPVPTVESDRTSLTVARSILGEDAPEEALAGFAAEITDYRRNIALLHPHARLLLVREYYRRVERSVRQIEQLLDGGPCAGLVAAVASVVVLAGVGMAGA